jgi:hypothetical protein
MAYKDVVREMFAKHKGKPPKEIMRMASAEWQKMKSGKSSKSVKGAGMFGDIGHGVDSVASLFGLGLEKPKRGRPRAGAVAVRNPTRAGGLFGDIGTGVDSISSLFGLGLEKPKAGALTHSTRRGRPRAGGVSAGGLFGDIGHGVDSVASLFGLGLEKPKAGVLRRKYPNENPTPNMPARNYSSTRKAYGGNQEALLGKVGRGRESGAIVERGSGVSAGGVSGGSFLDSLKMLPLMAMI